MTKNTYQPFSFISNGNKLRGIIIRPKDHLPGKLPVCICSHGIGINMLNTLTYAFVLASQGIAAVCYDFTCSGTGLSGGKSTDMSLLQQRDDIINVIQYVKGIPDLDPEKIYLLGCSQGGVDSALAAAKDPDDVQRLLLLYPGLSIPDLCREGHIMTAHFDGSNPPKTFKVLGGWIVLSDKYIFEGSSVDPYKEICTYDKPVFICHGSYDHIIDVKYARRAAKEYPHAAYEEIFGGHGFYTLYSRVTACHKLLQYLRAEHLVNK